MARFGSNNDMIEGLLSPLTGKGLPEAVKYGNYLIGIGDMPPSLRKKLPSGFAGDVIEGLIDTGIGAANVLIGPNKAGGLLRAGKTAFKGAKGIMTRLARMASKFDYKKLTGRNFSKIVRKAVNFVSKAMKESRLSVKAKIAARFAKNLIKGKGLIPSIKRAISNIPKMTMASITPKGLATAKDIIQDQVGRIKEVVENGPTAIANLAKEAFDVVETVGENIERGVESVYDKFKDLF